MELNVIYLKGIFYKKDNFFLKSYHTFDDLQKNMPYEISFENLNIKTIIFNNYKNNNIYNKLDYNSVKNYNIENFIKYYNDCEIILLLN